MIYFLIRNSQTFETLIRNYNETFYTIKQIRQKRAKMYWRKKLLPQFLKRRDNDNCNIVLIGRNEIEKDSLYGWLSSFIWEKVEVFLVLVA